MADRHSHWILGIIYINRDDSRFLVPLPCKLGLAINFGHPQCALCLSWLWSIVLLSGVIVPIVAHTAYFYRDPTPLFWWLLSILAAVAIFLASGYFSFSERRLAPLAAFGLIAAGVGFGIQSILNGLLVAWWGAENLAWPHHLLLAPIAALAQTFGKATAIYLLLQSRPARELNDYVRFGLLVGIGFAITEITLIFFTVTWSQVVLDNYLGVWERASSSMFHIYSSALVALSIGSRRIFPIAAVLVIHAVTDFLAGISDALPLSLYVLEFIFSICAVATWGLFLFFKPSNGGSHDPG